VIALFAASIIVHLLLRDLGSVDYHVRERASFALDQMHNYATESILRRQRDREEDAEARKRIVELLEVWAADGHLHHPHWMELQSWFPDPVKERENYEWIMRVTNPKIRRPWHKDN
jgi:hypothetical protein